MVVDIAAEHEEGNHDNAYRKTMTPKMSAAAKVQMAHDLRSTVRELKDRGLLVAAKW